MKNIIIAFKMISTDKLRLFLSVLGIFLALIILIVLNNIYLNIVNYADKVLYKNIDYNQIYVEFNSGYDFEDSYNKINELFPREDIIASIENNHVITISNQQIYINIIGTFSNRFINGEFIEDGFYPYTLISGNHWKDDNKADNEIIVDSVLEDILNIGSLLYKNIKINDTEYKVIGIIKNNEIDKMYESCKIDENYDIECINNIGINVYVRYNTFIKNNSTTSSDISFLINLNRNVTDEDIDLLRANFLIEYLSDNLVTKSILIEKYVDNMIPPPKVLTYFYLIVLFCTFFSIFITINLSLNERKYEIYIRRILGAKNSDIYLMIIIEYMLIGFISTVLAVLIGYIIGNIIAYILTKHLILYSLSFVLRLIIFSTVIIMIFSYISCAFFLRKKVTIEHMEN